MMSKLLRIAWQNVWRWITEPRHRVFILAQTLCAGFAMIWTFHLPLPGYAVAFIALAAAVMSIHGEMRASHKAAWMLIIGAFLVIEIRAIRYDRDLAANEQAEVRKREENNFKTIASGLEISIDNSQRQFAATMTQAKTILDKTVSISTLTEENLKNITGGESFAFVRPQVESAGKGPIGLVVWNHGSEVLTGVTIAFSRTNDANWGTEFFNRYTVGTIGPHDGAMIPLTITPQLGDNGTDHFWLMISAQNGTVDQTLDFRKSQKIPGTYAMRLTVTRRVKLEHNASASIPVLEREWTDEGGADLKLPSIRTSLRELRKNVRKIMSSQ